MLSQLFFSFYHPDLNHSGLSAMPALCKTLYKPDLALAQKQA